MPIAHLNLVKLSTKMKYSQKLLNIHTSNRSEPPEKEVTLSTPIESIEFLREHDSENLSIS